MRLHIFGLLVLALQLQIKAIYCYYYKDEGLLIVSFDALPHDVFNRVLYTPFLNFMRTVGVTTPYVRNAFPTLTHTNHHTIATGRHPQEHGVFGQSFYDKTKGLVERDARYTYDKSILPIWTLNEKRNKHSGCHGWPGSQQAYDGIKCTYREKENKSEPWTKRVDTVVSWFSNVKKPANLAMLYFDQPDTIMHAYGPDSQKSFLVTKTSLSSHQANEYIQKVDEIASYILWKLDRAKQGRVNVIFLSDHGMDWTSQPNFINLNKIIPKNSYKYYGHSPVLQIVPTNKKTMDEKQIYDKLKAASKTKNFDVYYAMHLPKRWKANNAQRFGPIVVVAKPRYAFQDKYRSQIYYEKVFGIKVSKKAKYGMHGYDNSYRPMNSMFLAIGKNIRPTTMLPPFDSVSMFPLFCKILKIKCIKTSGPNVTAMWNSIVV